MLLEIHALSLGACWLGEILNKKDDVVLYLHLDKNLEFMAVVTLGVPDEKTKEGSRKPLKSLIVGPCGA